MEIRFKTKKLEKEYVFSKKDIQAYGEQVATKYIMRINILKSVKSFDDLYSIPGLKFHPLKGDRKGEYSIYLTGYYRLIIKNDGQIFDIAKIEEVSKHYNG